MGQVRDKVRLLIAGELDDLLENEIFREGRLSGIQCARVSGWDGWRRMLEVCRFDAVILGIPERTVVPDLERMPHVPLYVVGKPRPGLPEEICFAPDEFRRSLGAIISEVSRRKRNGGNSAGSVASGEERS